MRANLERAYEENKAKEQKLIEVGRHQDIDFQQAGWIELQIEDNKLQKELKMIRTKKQQVQD